MSISIRDMAMAADECKTADGGCNAINIDILEERCQKMESQLGAMESKQRENAEKRINTFREIIAGMRQGIKPLDMIANLGQLNNAIKIRVSFMSESEDTILDSFYEKEFRKSGSDVSLASKIYSREELRRIIAEIKKPTDTKATFPADLIDKVAKASKGGKDVDANSLQEARRSLRAELSASHGISLGSFYEEIRSLNEKAVRARGENSSRLTYDDAVNIVLGILDSVVPDYPIIKESDENEIAFVNILIYPELLENLGTSRSVLDESQFDFMCETFNQLLGIDSADAVLTETLPCLGFGIPKTRQKPEPNPEPNPIPQPNPNPEPNPAPQPQPIPQGQSGNNQGLLERYLEGTRMRMSEYIEYANKIYLDTKERDAKQLSFNHKTAKQDLIILTAGAEALHTALDMSNEALIKISEIPQEYWGPEIKSFWEWLDKIGGYEGLMAHEDFLAGHAFTIKKFLWYRRWLVICFAIWFFVYGTVLSHLF